ncbi:hypothetical protein PUN28_016732 [Cardiocondyla obscurior]|uniref:Uncharacterized protein n=1 Tax=Cardiocondyla obscurior TaxID=286306 RepID=A0AAW2ENG5_9HYME
MRNSHGEGSGLNLAGHFSSPRRFNFFLPIFDNCSRRSRVFFLFFSHFKHHLKDICKKRENKYRNRFWPHRSQTNRIVRFPTSSPAIAGGY